MQGICKLSCVPLRAEPTSKSEMVSQLLFGETFRVQEKQGAWYHILTNFDEYPAWLNETQFSPLEEVPEEAPVLVGAPVAEITQGYRRLLLPAGADVWPNEDKEILIDGRAWKLNGSIRVKENTVNRDHLIADALHFEQAPYLWGGKTIFGMDCSGFTQVVYKLNGITLMRDAWQQASMGTSLSFLDEAEPGDLAFFDNEDGKITHVGILIGSQRIIHASGSVRIDSIDQQGIFNTDSGRYTHKLRLIRKVIA